MNGRDLVIGKVQAALGLPTKKAAVRVLNAVIAGIEQTLLEHLAVDGFSVKLNSLGKFTVRHSPARSRKVPYIGKVVQVPAKRKVRFISLGTLKG